METQRWVLPEGIEELLPHHAKQVDELRRHLLSLFHTWGYDLVIPPLIEYMDSLQVGSGEDLSALTFKLIDPLNGRLLGVRSDMTPQVARIDARRLQHQGPARLCYLGPVLQTKASELGGSRSPIQVGAELYGHAGIESDFEIVDLMIEALSKAGVNPIYLDLGHVNVFRGLAKQAQLSKDQEQAFFNALQRKSQPELLELSQGIDNKKVAMMMQALIELNGGEEVFSQARTFLASASADVLAAIDRIEALAKQIQNKYEMVQLHFDFAELRGYGYHTGLVFAAYAPGNWQAIAKGGRYDEIGAVFGRSRPATGFSLDLNMLLRLNNNNQDTQASGIFAPAEEDSDLEKIIQGLRQQGERVIRELPGQQLDMNELGCDRKLVKKAQQWQVERLT